MVRLRGYSDYLGQRGYQGERRQVFLCVVYVLSSGLLSGTIFLWGFFSVISNLGASSGDRGALLGAWGLASRHLRIFFGGKVSTKRA